MSWDKQDKKEPRIIETRWCIGCSYEGCRWKEGRDGLYQEHLCRKHFSLDGDGPTRTKAYNLCWGRGIRTIDNMIGLDVYEARKDWRECGPKTAEEMILVQYQLVSS